MANADSNPPLVRLSAAETGPQDDTRNADAASFLRNHAGAACQKNEYNIVLLGLYAE
jgi:hypothetical protein